MKRSSLWIGALAMVLGCTLAGRAIGDDGSFADPFDATPSLVRLTGATAWNADPDAQDDEPSPFAEEPAKRPKPVDGAVGSTGSGTCTCNGSCGGSCGSSCSSPCSDSCSSSCDSELSCGCDDFCCCEPEHSLIASVEATFFWPQFNREFLRTTVNSATANLDLASTAALNSVDGGYLAAPRLTLGVQGCCWGLVGRYWYASPWASSYTPSNPALAPAGVRLFDDFRAYTLDLELQRRFYLGSWTGYGLFGVRYAFVENDRTLDVTNLSLGETITTSSFAGQQFSGTGITFGFWGTRPICCDSPLNFFVANRYSVLWGNGNAASENTTSVMNDVNGFATSTNGALAAAPGDMFIAEVQLGLQWEAQLKCFPGRAFVRSAVEWQYWDTNAGVFAASDAVASVGAGGNATASSSAGDMLFDLIGVNLGAGITF